MGVVKVIDHAIHHICQQKVVVVVKHTDVINDSLSSTDLLVIELCGDKEILNCEIEDNLK